MSGGIVVFSSAIFLFGFLPAFLIAAFVSARFGVRARNLNLVLFSLAFYVFGSGLYTLVLIGSILINYLIGRHLIRPGGKQSVLVFSMVINLMPLIIFKYLDFFFSLTEAFFFKPFLSLQLPALNLLLPVGISFYTFQAMAYIVDIHRGRHGSERDLTTFAAYMLMFPQLVAGPIVRFGEIRENLHQTRITISGLNAGLFFFGVGLAKKMLVADPIGLHVDAIYALSPGDVTVFMAWFAAIGYFLQILFDFSGYSHMAIGIGLMVGFSFPENFRQPYRAQSITEFWRRWHITLSAWFRDYLYIPLGGNRAGTLRTIFNLTIVFLLCGLWHGAALTFLAWGAFHGLLLALERILKRTSGIAPAGLAGVILTTVLVIFGWVLFRSADFAQANAMMAKMLLLDTSGSSLFGWQYYLTPYMIAVFGLGLLFAWLPSETWRVRERVQAGWGVAGGLMGLVLIILSVAVLSAKGFNPFIYFQF